VPLYDSADLLQRFRDLAGRPAVDEALPDAKAFRLLTDAHRHWTEQMAAQVPEALFTPAVKLYSADGGYTYLVAAVEGAAAEEPLALRVRESRGGRLLLPGPDWSDATGYVLEGDRIRFPNHRSRSFTDGPYAQWIVSPGEISAGAQPTLKPVRARVLAVYRALATIAPVIGKDPNHFYNLETELWTGRPDDPSDVGLLGSLKQMYQGGYGMGVADGRWWVSSDLGG